MQIKATKAGKKFQGLLTIWHFDLYGRSSIFFPFQFGKLRASEFSDSIDSCLGGRWTNDARCKRGWVSQSRSKSEWNDPLHRAVTLEKPLIFDPDIISKSALISLYRSPESILFGVFVGMPREQIRLKEDENNKNGSWIRRVLFSPRQLLLLDGKLECNWAIQMMTNALSFGHSWVVVIRNEGRWHFSIFVGGSFFNRELKIKTRLLIISDDGVGELPDLADWFPKSNYWSCPFSLFSGSRV